MKELFKDILTKLRLEKQITQTELANKIGVVKGTIANYESGLRKPDNDKLIALSEVFGVSVDYLLGLEKNNILNKTKTESVFMHYSGNERINNIVKELLKTDLAEDDLKLIEFILDKYKN